MPEAATGRLAAETRAASAGEVMSDTLETRELGKVPGLTGVRAVAIALVILLHSDPAMKGGWIGVEVFFVLSGFLITSLLLNERSTKGTFSVLRFYLRRIFRLIPAFWAFLLVILAWAAIWRRHAYGVWRHDVFESATYQMDFYQLAHVANNGIGLTWTLAVEEQFYLVWPLVLLLGLKLLRRRTLMAAIAAGILVSLAEAIIMGHHGVPYRRLYFGADTNAMPLLIGCLAAFVFTGTDLRSFARSRLASIIPVMTLVVLFAVLGTVPNLHDWVFEGPTFIVSLLVAATLLSLATNERTPVARLLSLPGTVYVGLISYSLYLWNEWALLITAHIGHGQVNKVAHAGLGLALTLALVLVSYYCVELPGQKLKGRFARRRDRVPVLRTGNLQTGP